jgi:hypothetical protein
MPADEQDTDRRRRALIFTLAPGVPLSPVV